MTHRHAAVVGALLVLALPLTGALPAQAAPQAHNHAHDRADNTHPGEPDTADDTGAAEAAAHNDTDTDEEDASDADRPEHAGPPTDMPGQAPAFVADIHRLVQDFLAGNLDGPLGHQVSAATPGGGR